MALLNLHHYTGVTVELLWGVSKMLDLMESDCDFTVVFDYVCDVEIHFDDSFEFYQIKTHKNRAPYTAKKLSIKDGEHSIIGTLYAILPPSNTIPIKLAIVSNSPFNSAKRTFEGCFSNLPDGDRQILQEALTSELGISCVDFSCIYFLYTNMNLENPEYEIQGKLTMTFERIKGCEPSNPNALYRLVFDTVSSRACYEYSAKDYEDVIKYKGLTRAEFNKMLDAHAENAKTGIRETKEYIDTLSDIKAKRAYNKALPEVLKLLTTSKAVQRVEKLIVKYLLSTVVSGDTFESLLERLIDEFYDKFPKEISNAEKVVLYIVLLKRYEIGAYDNEDDI